jgi:hypothetical protein
MFSVIVIAMNNLLELRRSLHTSIDTLLAAKPHMDLTNVTAAIQEVDLNLSRSEAGLNGVPDAATTPLMWIAGQMSLVNHG